MHIHLPDRLIDLDHRRVRRADGDELLTELEAKLLAYLAEREGNPVHRDTLLVEVWGYPKPVVTRCVDTAIRRLRTKLEPTPSEPRHLVLVHGEGYRFLANPTPLGPNPLAPLPSPLPEGAALSPTDAEALLAAQLNAPLSPALRAWLPTLGGLPGPLLALAAALRTAPEARVLAQLQAQPARLLSELPSPALPDALAPLRVFAGPFWQADAEALLGAPLDRQAHLAQGFLQALPDGQLLVPFPHRVAAATSHEARLAHLAWVHTLSEASAPELSPRLAEVRQAIRTATALRGDATVQLIWALAQPLSSLVSATERLGWLDSALHADTTPAVRARGLMMRARALRQLTRLPEAHASLDEADALAALPGEVLAERALVFHAELRREEALHTYQRAAIALEHSEPRRALLMREEAATLMHRLEQYDEAEQLARETARRAERLGDPDRTASAELRLGRILSHKGWHWEALPRMRAALAAMDQLGAHYQVAFGLFSLGDACIDAGELAEAAQTLQRGRALAEQLALPSVSAMYASGQGLVHVLQHDPAAAKPFLEASLKLHHDCGQPQRTFYPLGWLAVVYADLAQPELARSALRQVIQLADQDAFSQHLLSLFEALVHVSLNEHSERVTQALARVSASPHLAQSGDLRVAFKLLNARCHNSGTP